MVQNPLTAIVRTAFNDTCKDFSTAVAERGFIRTKARFWVHVGENTIDVLYLFRSGSSYGAPYSSGIEIEIKSAIRLPNETTDYLALNGPQSDVARTRAGKYCLRFNAESRHGYERCLSDLIRFVETECEPWFDEMRRDTATRFGARLELSDETRKVLGLTKPR